MIILLLTLSILLIFTIIYLLYYKKQIKEIGSQLAFISKHDSFKFIQTQIKPKEISQLVELCNTLLDNQKELKQQFIKKNEEINATIVSLSHDIRTPLTSLDGYLQLAGRTKNTQEKEDYIKQAQSRAKQINRLVDELFLYTKLQNKEYALEFESIDIVNILEKCLLSFIDDFSQKRVEPDLDLPKTTVYITGNSSAIDRVFENVIKNYLLHGKGMMTIRSEERENEVRLHFINLMNGEKPIDLNQIFTRFYKEDISRTNHSSGLGLYIVKSLMKQMHGSAVANIEHNQFCLSLIFNKAHKEKDDGK